MRRRACLLGLVWAGAALVGCDGAPGEGRPAIGFHSVDITGATYAQQLELPDVEGRVRSLAEFRGKVVVVFFGFVHCPDVCPTTLGELAQVKKALGPQGDKLVAVFVTVDPARDSAELLKNYVATFDPGFVALRGSEEQVAAAARHFKVFYEKVPGTTPDNYTVNHTAGSYVFDTQGRVRLFARYGQPLPELTSDIRALVNGA